MKRKDLIQIMSLCVIVGAFLCSCSGAKGQVRQKSTKATKNGDKVWITRIPDYDPCWIVDLTEECIKSEGITPVDGSLYVTGVSDEKYEEDDGRLSAQEHGTRQIVNNMKAYIKKSVKEAGCSEEKADRIIAESVVQDVLFSATYEGIKDKTWVKKWALRCWQDWTGRYYTPEKWKVYALVEVQQDALSDIEKAALDVSKLLDKEVRERAKDLIEELKREKGILE